MQRRTFVTAGVLASAAGCLRLQDNNGDEDQTGGTENDDTDGPELSDGETDDSEEEAARLYAFDESGQAEWTHDTLPNGQETRIDYVVTDDDVVAYATVDSGGGSEQDPVVRGLDTATGDLLWEFPFERGFYSGLAIYGDTLYIGRLGELVLLELQSGTELDRYDYSIGFNGLVAGPSTLYITADTAVAFDPSTNSERWRGELERQPESRPVLADGRLYYGTESGYVVAIDADSGERIWETRVEESVRYRTVVTDEFVLVIDEADSVYAIDRSAGEIVYRHDAEIDGYQLATVGNRVYIPEAETPTVYEVSGSGSGIALTELWESPVRGISVFSREEEFVVARRAIHRLDPDGTIVWQAEMDDGYSVSVAGAGEAVAADNGRWFVGASE